MQKINIQIHIFLEKKVCYSKKLIFYNYVIFCNQAFYITLKTFYIQRVKKQNIFALIENLFNDDFFFHIPFFHLSKQG